MKISIAMATYNGEKYLQEQLDSFVQQTRQPDELVVTDDCSVDGTPELLELFAETAPFDVIIHRNERNYGYCGNFNQALLRTNGDLVFLSDQDDVWFSEKIERMSRAAEENPDAFVLMNDAALTHGNLSETGLTKLGQRESAGFSEENFVMGCCAAVRRELLDLCLPIPEGFSGHDNWIVGIAGGMRRKRVIPAVLQYYRRHVKNTSHVITNRTKPVGRWTVRWDQVKRFLAIALDRSPYAKRLEAEAQTNAKFLLAWAQQAAESSDGAYVCDLSHFLKLLERHHAILNQRERIRQSAFSDRVREVANAYRAGLYDDNSGWKLALRDLAG